MRASTLTFAVLVLWGCTEGVSPTGAPVDPKPTAPASIYTRYDYLNYTPFRVWRANGSIINVGTALAGEGPVALQYTDEGGVSQAEWLENKFHWRGDTLFRRVYDRMTFGAQYYSGCTFGTTTSYSVGPFSTISGGCYADWVTAHFNVVRHATYSPSFSTSISGPAEIYIPTNYTWTAHASGGSGLYWYSWQQSFNGFQWQTVCGDTPHCTVAVADGSAPFTLKATVWTTGPNDPYGQTGAHVQSPTYSVWVAPPGAPLQAWIVGPQNIDPNWGGTWSVGTSGGYDPKSYSWTWNGAWIGNGTSVSMSGLSPASQYDLALTVSDASGRSTSTGIIVLTNTGTCPPDAPPGCAEYRRVPSGSKAKPKPSPSPSRKKK